MAKFRYRARDRSGALVKGLIERASAEEAARELIALGLYPSRIAAPLSFRPAPRRLWFAQPPVPDRDLALFLTRFATLLKSGIPVGASIGLLIEQAPDGRLREIVRDMKSAVEEGASLSGAMARHGDVFTQVHAAMISAGEATGRLDACMLRLASALEREADAKERVKEVTRYPKIVAAGMGAAVAVLTGFVAPRYAAVFEKIKTPLPAPTKALMAISSFAGEYWLWGALAAAAGYLVFRHASGREKGRLLFDGMILKTPVLGPIVTYFSMARWTNVLGHLVASGTPIIQSIELSAGVVGNLRLSRAVKDVAGRVAEGEGLAEPLRKSGAAPPIAARMIAAGEASGALDEMLFEVSGFLESEADRKVRKLMACVEPALIVLLGGIVLFLALSVFLPMWDMTRLARRV